MVTLGVFVEKVDKAVKGHRRAFRQFRRVELIEDVADEYGMVDACQGKLQDKLATYAAGVYVELLFVVEIALTSAEQDVVNLWLHLLFEGSVSPDTELEIRTVVANHIDKTFRKFVAVFFVNPTLDCKYHLRMIKGHDVIPPSGITTISGEVAAVMHSFKCYAEVIAAGVHRITQVLDSVGCRK